jgi:hypothetical protein
LSLSCMVVLLGYGGGQLDVRSGGCPFPGHCGHQQIFARDGSVARDPYETFGSAHVDLPEP